MFLSTTYDGGEMPRHEGGVDDVGSTVDTLRDA